MFYETGTVTLSEGATSIAFAGTDLIANVKVGDEFLAAGGSARVTAIADDTHLTIFPAWTGEAGSGMAYKIARGAGWASTAVVSQAVQVLVNRLNAGLLMAPNAYGEMGTGARDAYDGQKAGFLYLDVPPEGETDPAVMYVKLSDADADWGGPLSGPGMGDIVGPSSAADNRLAAFDGTTGKLLRDSGKTLSDLVPGTRTITAGAGLTGGGALSADRSIALSSDSIAGLALAAAAAPAADPTFTGVARFPSGTSSAPSIAHAGDTDTGISFGSNILRFSTAATLALVIDDTQRFVLGHSASVPIGAAADIHPRLQQHGTDLATSHFVTYAWIASGTGPAFNGAKSRNPTPGSHTIVQLNDVLASFSGYGSDGANFIPGASILFRVDNTPGTNDMPTRIVFMVTADGAASTTEAVRISSARELQMGGANTVIDANRHHQNRSYTVGTLPSAATAGQEIYVSNETGGAVLAFSDGTNWRRVTDRNVVS